MCQNCQVAKVGIGKLRRCKFEGYTSKGDSAYVISADTQVLLQVGDSAYTNDTSTKSLKKLSGDHLLEAEGDTIIELDL